MMIDRITEFLSESWLFLVAFAAILLMVYFIAISEDTEETAFMAECQRSEPHYKCVALWRQGNSRTVVMPVYTGR